MPTNRTRRRLRRKAGLELTLNHRWWLERGRFMLAVGHIGLDELRPLWHAHKEAILRDWIEANPGTRPHGWWLWDRPADERADGESEREYLERHGLLTEGELEALVELV